MNIKFVLIIILTCLISITTISAQDNETTYIVKYKQSDFNTLDQNDYTTKNAILSTIKSNNSKIQKEFSNLVNGAVMNLTQKQYQQLKQSPLVDSIHKQMEYELLINDSVSLYNISSIWNKTIDLNPCNNNSSQCISGNNISIGIIDTGIDYTHPNFGSCTNESFLAGNCTKIPGGYDFANDSPDPIDPDGHGTHVASIAAGNGSIKGFAPNATLYAYDVFGGGTASNTDIIDALEVAVNQTDIVVMSLGIDCKKTFGSYTSDCGPNDVLSQAVNDAVDQGLNVVIASGNNGTGYEKVHSPGTAEKAITVGSLSKSFSLSSFSSKGPVKFNSQMLLKPDIVSIGENVCAARANGTSIFSCLGSQNYVIKSGTSMATPQIAGTIALVKQKNNNWTPQQLKQSILQTATPISASPFAQGYGNQNPLKAIELNTTPKISKLSNKTQYTNIQENITGTIESTNFLNYSVEIANLNNYSDKTFNWNKICSSTQLPNETLCSFNTLNIDNGEYLVKLNTTRNSSLSETTYSLININSSKINITQKKPESENISLSTLSLPVSLVFTTNSSTNQTEPFNLSSILYNLDSTTTINRDNDIVNNSKFIGNLELKNYSTNSTTLIIDGENSTPFNYTIPLSINTNFSNLSQNFKGNTTNINTNIPLNISHQNLTNLTLKSKNTSLFIIPHNFSKNPYDLTTTTLKIDNTTNNAKIITRNTYNPLNNEPSKIMLNLTGDTTKYSSLCIRENTTYYFSEFSNDCHNNYYLHNITSDKNTSTIINGVNYTATIKNNNTVEISKLLNNLSQTKYSTAVSQVCTEDWEYSDWSECVDGTQEKTPQDTNTCGTEFEKPQKKTQSCEEETDDTTDDTNTDDSNNDNGRGGGGTESSQTNEETTQDSQEETTQDDEETSQDESQNNNPVQTLNNQNNKQENTITPNKNDDNTYVVRVDNVPITTDTTFSGEQSITLSDENNEVSLVQFTHDFSKSKIDLSSTDIKYNETSSQLIVNGVDKNISSKTLSIPMRDYSNFVCIKDEEVDSFNNLSGTCSDEGEILLECNSEEQQGYNCSVENKNYVISGLSHSAVYETQGNQQNTIEETNSNNSLIITILRNIIPPFAIISMLIIIVFIYSKRSDAKKQKEEEEEENNSNNNNTSENQDNPDEDIINQKEI